MIHTKKLVIVAGPSAVGKSTLFDNLLQGNLIQLQEQLGIEKTSSFISLDAQFLPKVTESFIDRLILHYDILYRYSTTGDFSYISDLISNSKNVAVLTLCARYKTLSKRFNRRVIRASALFLVKPGKQRAKKMFTKWNRRLTYFTLSNLFHSYGKWSELMRDQSVETHLLLDPAGPDVTIGKPFDISEVRLISGYK